MSTNGKIILSILFLLLFLVSTYTIALGNKLSEYQELLLSFELVLITYVCGLCINFKELPLFPLNFIIINLFAYAGGIIWVFASVFVDTGMVVNPMQAVLLTRGARNIWTQLYINGPSLDLYSYLGVSLISMLLYGYLDKSQTKIANAFALKLALLLGWILFGLAIYSSIALGARTPWLVIAVSLVSCFLAIFLGSGTVGKKILPALTIASITAMAVIWSEAIIASFSKLALFLGVGDVFARFEEYGMETGRYQAYAAVISGMLDYPAGGRQIAISEGYAHNIWLDSAYDTGIISMLFLCLYHLIQIIFLIRLLKSDLPTILKVFSICSTVAFFAAFLQAPVIQASIGYFILSCFYFGSTIGIMSAVEEENLHKQQGEITTIQRL